MTPRPVPRPRLRSHAQTAPAGQEPRPGALSASTTQIAIGATVHDRDSGRPGTVRNIQMRTRNDAWQGPR